MKKTIACCLLLATSTPTWAEPLELPRRLAPLDAALAAVENVGAVREPPLRVGSSEKKRSRKKLYLSAALAVGAGCGGLLEQGAGRCRVRPLFALG